MHVSANIVAWLAPFDFARCAGKSAEADPEGQQQQCVL
jgi:hypothetical protein